MTWLEFSLKFGYFPRCFISLWKYLSYEFMLLLALDMANVCLWGLLTLDMANACLWGLLALDMANECLWGRNTELTCGHRSSLL